MEARWHLWYSNTCVSFCGNLQKITKSSIGLYSPASFPVLIIPCRTHRPSTNRLVRPLYTSMKSGPIKIEITTSNVLPTNFSAVPPQPLRRPIRFLWLSRTLPPLGFPSDETFYFYWKIRNPVRFSLITYTSEKQFIDNKTLYSSKCWRQYWPSCYLHFFHAGS